MLRSQAARVAISVAANLALSELFLRAVDGIRAAAGSGALSMLSPLAVPLVALVMATSSLIIITLIYDSAIPGILNSVAMLAWVYQSGTVSAWDLAAALLISQSALYPIVSKLLKRGWPHLADLHTAFRHFLSIKPSCDRLLALALYFYLTSIFVFIGKMVTSIARFQQFWPELVLINAALASSSIYVASAAQVRLSDVFALSLASTLGYPSLAPALGELLWALSWGRPPTSRLPILATREGILLGRVAAVIGRSGERGRLVLSRFEQSESGPYLRLDLPRLQNQHMVIVGSSGSGKTSLVKKIVTQMATKYGYRIIVLDPHDEYFDTLASIGETSIVEPGSGGINILYLGKVSPLQRAAQVADTISAIFNLGSVQRRLLEEAILEAYKRRGILSEDELTWRYPPPTADDLLQTCMELASVNREYESLIPYVKTLKELAVFESPGPPEPVGQNVVVSLSKAVNDYARVLFAEAALHAIVSNMYERGRQPVAVVIEEAGVLTGRRVAEKLLSRLYMESRKFGLSIITVAQNPLNLPRPALNNAAVRIAFNLSEPRNRQYVAKMLAPPGDPGAPRLVEDVLSLLKPGNFIVSVLGYADMFIVSNTD